MKTCKTVERIWETLILGILVILVVIPVALAGCSKTQQVLVREQVASQETLEGRWNLRSYGPIGSETIAPAENPIFHRFCG